MSSLQFRLCPADFSSMVFEEGTYVTIPAAGHASLILQANCETQILQEM
jgi:hypothetical protein